MAACCSHQSVVGLQQVKIKLHALGDRTADRTADRSGFFRLEEQTLAEGLGHKAEQKFQTLHPAGEIHDRRENKHGSPVC